MYNLVQTRKVSTSASLTFWLSETAIVGQKMVNREVGFYTKNGGGGSLGDFLPHLFKCLVRFEAVYALLCFALIWLDG